MKRNLTRASLLLALTALFAVAGFAQEPTTAPQQSEEKANVERRMRLEGRKGRMDRGGRMLRRGGRGGEGHGARAGIAGRGLGRLNLTDAQRQQIREIESRYAQSFRAQREEMRKLHELRQGGAALTTEQKESARRMREELRANADKMRGEIQNLLTPEQREQIRKQREEMKARRDEFKTRRMERKGDATKPPVQ
ncbi:MAG: Spy/CpxP family protein refolding chaperone [Acidobacteria bacterium]|nr:Spy/CpxP family protein refolding chaperone [Acidobacteriota bacterium]MCA1640889.1 Spy/CpxP family protein refolding chaperone [Acidobacteriota bacterium]